MQPASDDVKTCEHIKQYYDALKGSTERSNCETHWQELAELVSPRKLDFVGVRTPGEKRMTRVYDPVGIHANEMLAAGLHGMATSPSSKWFSLRLVGEKILDQEGETVDINEVPAVQEYLSDLEEVMWQRIYQPGTNFTSAIHEFYLDLGCFGTAIMFLGQRENGQLMFETVPLAHTVIAENAEHHVDTVFRCSEYTVRQIYQLRKTKDNPDGWEISDHVKNLWDEKKFDDKVKVIHGVYPRAERDVTKRGPKDMEFVSIYFEHETSHILEEGGFPDFPFLVTRWGKYAGEVYGRSPAMVALPDIKMLQAEVLTLIKLLQKAADPPMWLRDDGVVGGTRTVPGGINYWRGNPNDGVMLQPVSLAGIQALVQHIEAIKQSILRTFYADLMRMPEDIGNTTATEYMQRVSERMRLLGPLLGRLESEALGPMVVRLFGILTRMKLTPGTPDIVVDREFSVEYVSPIATAQKQTAIQGVAQAMQFALSVGGEQMGPQIIQKNVDIDKTFRWVWDLLNNDPDLLADEEAQDASNQQAQLMQAIQAGLPISEIAKNLGGSIKQIAGGAKDVSQGQGVPDGIDISQVAQSAIQGASQPQQGVDMMRRYGAAVNEAQDQAGY